MALVDEIKQMRSRGLNESQIRDNLKARGVPDNQVSEAFSQAQIKEAVSSDSFPISKEQNSPARSGFVEPRVQAQQSGEMEKSILLPQEQENQQQEEYTPQYPQQKGYETTPPVSPPQNSIVQEYSPQDSGYQDYQPYQSYSAGPSPDLITEISEQIIAEKLSAVRKALEKSLDIRNTLGTKIDYIDERLKRIEKIMDALQSSVLRKVGDYVNDVQDIKKELIETQKSFTKIQGKKHPGHKPHKAHKK